MPNDRHIVAILAQESVASSYRTIYDFGSGYPLLQNSFPLLFVAVGVGACVYHFRQRGRTRSDRLARGFLLLWTAGAALLSARVYLSTYSDYVYYRDMLRSGRVQVVKGIITHFSPEPPEGHHDESFDVAGQHFSYSKYMLNAGFNRSWAAGGPLRDSMQVRIAHLDGRILRLEVLARDLSVRSVP